MTNLPSTCLILGSNSDVGQATAYQFAKNGFNIILATRTIDEYQKRLASDISIRHQVSASNIMFNATKTEEHLSFYQNLPSPPDVVVSVFGYLGHHEQAISDDFSESSTILNTNLNANVSILNIIANDMGKRGRGCIIGVSSVAGERGRASNYIYGCAKAGFTTYLSGLRNRLSKMNVHVSSIIPGFIDTKMTKGLNLPKPLTAQAKDVAIAIEKAYRHKKDIVYVLPIWRLIMLVIRNIPERIFKKLSL